MMRTTLTPAFKLWIKSNSGQKEITTIISDRLITLSLTDNRGFELDALEITLDDSDGKLILPEKGITLTLYLGWKKESLIDKGDFVVDEISYSGSPDIITISARSADFKSSMAVRYTQSYHKTTLGSIIKKIAAKNKIDYSISNELSVIEIKHIDQTESDINFLTRLAIEHDAIATMKKGRLLFISTGKATSASGKSLPTLIINRSSGDNYHYSIAQREEYAAVIGNYIDTTSKKSGSVIFDGTKNTKQKQMPVDTENVFILRHQYANRSNAYKAAKAKFHQLKRGVATFNIMLASARPDLFPECPIKVIGFKEQIDNESWIVKNIKHELSENGFISSLELESKIIE